MTRSITFLHTADLHLGAPMRGLRALTDDWAERVRLSIAKSFDRVVRIALQRRVDFVIIAGDSFDAARASYADYVRFFDGLEKWHDAGIPVYLVAGNHDPYTSWARDVDRLPASARLLGVGAPSFELYEREGEPLCLIGGRSYYNQTWPAEEDIAEGITREAAERALAEATARPADVPFSIGIIHTALEFDRKRAPTSEEKLRASGIDYWACGHLHQRYVRPSLQNPRIAFPGCIQGRDIKETGERGCHIVQLVEGEVPHVEFVSTASVALQSLKVEVGPSRTLTDLERHIQSELFRVNGTARCEEMVARITLTGRTELHGFLSREEVLEGVRKRLNEAYPSFYCDALIDRTLPATGVDVEADRIAAGPFAALVGRMGTIQRRRDEETINYIQSEFVKRGLSVPGSLSSRVDDFSASAERLVLDLLESE